MNFLYESNLPKDLKSKRSLASFAAKPWFTIAIFYNWSMRGSSFKQIKCYCQRKPCRSKRSRSAFDLHFFTIEKPPEKIINGGIFRSWLVFYFKINIFLKSGPYTGLTYFDFRPTFVESTWKNAKWEKLAIRFFTSPTHSKLIEVQQSFLGLTLCSQCRA